MKECNCFACQQQKEYENSIIGMREVPIYKCINQKEMKTKTLKYKGEIVTPLIIGGKGVYVDERILYVRELDKAVLFLEENDIEYVEEVKFKKGDIAYYSDSYGTWICVFDYEVMSSSTQYIAMLNKFNKLHFNDYMDVICQRLATDSEKQLLFDALEKDGKYWDSESLEVKELGLSDRIDRILFDLRNCSESVVDASEKIRNIIDKEVNKAVNEIYK